MAPRKRKAAEGNEEQAKPLEGQEPLAPLKRVTRSMTRQPDAKPSSELTQPNKEKPKSKSKPKPKANAKAKPKAKPTAKDDDKESVDKVEEEEEQEEVAEAAEEEKAEDDDGAETKAEPEDLTTAAEDGSHFKTVVVEHCKQCNSFKTRATQVKEGLEKGVPGIKVLLNPEKPRRGCFEIREEGGDTFISLLDMKRPFKPMKDLDMEKVISDIIDKIK